MNELPPPYPEYPEHLNYIQDARVRKAFVYLVDQAQRIQGYTARPWSHGYISRNLHYFDVNDWSPYAFTVNQNWLLFYLRKPAQTHPGIEVETVKQMFEEVNLLKNGEINFKIRTLGDAQAAMQLVFPDLPVVDEYSFPDEVPGGATYSEGAVSLVKANSYERNPHARAACIKHYGYRCSVCDFSFEDAYGSLGENFIHVHHLVELSSIGAEYEVDPIRDLRPVCPNCHAMLHRRSPPLSIEELKRNLTRPSNGPSPTRR